MSNLILMNRKIRSTTIGGSELGVFIGAGFGKTIFMLQEEKRGKLLNITNDRMYWGKSLERHIYYGFKMKYKKYFSQFETILSSKRGRGEVTYLEGIYRATYDYLAIDEKNVKTIIDIKFSSSPHFQKEIPLVYAMQGLHYMRMFNADNFVIMVLLNGVDKIYKYTLKTLKNTFYYEKTAEYWYEEACKKAEEFYKIAILGEGEYLPIEYLDVKDKYLKKEGLYNKIELKENELVDMYLDFSLSKKGCTAKVRAELEERLLLIAQASAAGSITLNNKVIFNIQVSNTGKKTIYIR